MNRLLLTLALLAIPATAFAAEKYALLIGVTTYENAHMNRNPLKYPEADATAVAELLKSSGYEVKVLIGKQATQKAIETELTKFEQQGTQDGVVFIGLFGHGVQYGSDAYYCPYDVKLRKVTDAKGKTVPDENGKPTLQPDPAAMTSMGRLLEALNTAGAGNRILIADCCREDPSAARGLTGRAFGSSVKISDLEPGTAAIFSCSNTEQAFEHDDWKHGAFTKAFLDYCSTLGAGSDATVSTMTTPLFRSVESMVKAKEAGKTQRVNPITNGIVDLKIELKSKTPTDITNSIGMKLKLIPAGEFLMGSSATRGDLEAAGFVLPDSFDNTDEQPAHRVRITKAFYMGIHEVTRGQFAAFVKDTGYQTEAEKDGKGGYGIDDAGNGAQKPEYTWKDNGSSQTDSHPVINVSWNDAVEFIKWLNANEAKKYRLPTEAEWEHCCRAGSGTHFSSGDSLLSLKGVGNVRDVSYKGKYTSSDDKDSPPFPFDDGFVYTSPVGRFQLNDFGLYDMHGNVWEWCQNGYDSTAYKSRRGTTNDPFVEFGSYRVYRGGSWGDSARDCRSASRYYNDPSFRRDYLGFRLALSPSVQ